MPKKLKEIDKSNAPGDETGVNGHAAKPAANKVTATRKRTAPRKKSASKKATQVSDEAIRTRAYFIAEHRERMSLPGDAHSDWLEARRQLLAELAES